MSKRKKNEKHYVGWPTHVDWPRDVAQAAEYLADRGLQPLVREGAAAFKKYDMPHANAVSQVLADALEEGMSRPKNISKKVLWWKNLAKAVLWWTANR